MHTYQSVCHGWQHAYSVMQAKIVIFSSSVRDNWSGSKLGSKVCMQAHVAEGGEGGQRGVGEKEGQWPRLAYIAVPTSFEYCDCNYTGLTYIMPGRVCEAYMGCNDNLVEVVLVEKGGEEGCGSGSRPHQAAVCCKAIAIVGIHRGRCLPCTHTHTRVSSVLNRRLTTHKCIAVTDPARST